MQRPGVTPHPHTDYHSMLLTGVRTFCCSIEHGLRRVHGSMMAHNEQPRVPRELYVRDASCDKLCPSAPEANVCRRTLL